MKKSLLSIGLIGASLFGNSVYADVTRESGNERMNTPPEVAKREVSVSPALLARNRNVTPEVPGDARLRVLTRDTRTKVRKQHKRNAAPAKAGQLATTALKGFRVYPSYGISPQGWYSWSGSTASLNWEKPSAMTAPYGGGFVRNGQLYAFAYAATQTGITDAGMYLLDEPNGNPVGTINFDVFDSAEKCVLRAVYDDAADIAYVITYNKTGNGYKLQKFNASDYSFTDLGVTVPSDWIAFAWSPSDKTVYMLDESCALSKYDSAGKKFVNVHSYSYDMDTYVTSMAYSPKDEGFVALLPTWDNMDNEILDMVLLKLDGTITKIGSLGDEQWSILQCFDPYAAPGAPATPSDVKVNVEGPALTGSISVKLPEKLESGNPISGKVYLEVTLDGNKVNGSFSGTPGQSLSIPVDVAEGMHRYEMKPYVLGNAGKLYGTPAIVERFFGYDTPEKPAGVKLTDKSVKWNAVTTGVHLGYVEASTVTYNVYLDGKKLNSAPVTETSYSVSISGASASGHIAEVEAVAAGKVSDKGVSDTYYGKGAMELPVSIKADPATGDLEQSMIDLFSYQRDPLNAEPLRGWRYDDQAAHTGGFYCLAPLASSTGNLSDEWLFLPAINFADKDKMYRFSMDVWTGDHPFTAPETYEVTLTRNPNSTDAVVIRESETVSRKPNFETSETIFSVPEAGVWYIGIHYTSPLNSFRLYARNFNVAEAGATADAPAAVSLLAGTPGERGELVANISFVMPATNVTGGNLAESTVVTATADAGAGEVSVSGAPGASMTLAVPTLQGENIIKVTTSTDAGKGLVAELPIYTGVYRPATPEVSATATDDNLTLKLSVRVPEINELGQFAGEAGDVIIYRRVAEEWRPFENIGALREWSYSVASTDAQDLYQFGVAVQNEAGYSEIMHTFGVHLGTPFQIPLKEVYALQGEDVIMKYEPVTIQQLGEDYCSWGFTDPGDLLDEASNDSGVALYATWMGSTQLMLPRFSTKGAHNAKADFSLFFGSISPQFVTIYAESPNMELSPIAQFSPEDGNGWEHKLVTLPSQCQNVGWVQLAVHCDLTDYTQYMLMDGYSVSNYPENMITISAMEGNSRAVAGEPYELAVVLENAGTNDLEMPAYTMTLVGDNGIIGNLTAENAPRVISASERVRLDFKYTPRNADVGNVLARFSIEGQPEVAVSEMEKSHEVLAAPIPSPEFIKVEKVGNHASLTWGKARDIESFELADAWTYGDKIRGFKNIDRDYNNVWSISELTYPGKYTPKAFQVFNLAGNTNPLLSPRSGEQYLVGLSSTKGKTDDWLISPEVVPGSDVSLWVDILDPQYAEVLSVMYSTTGDNPEDFLLLPDAEIAPDTREWQKYEFTLPADAKYFALHHHGLDGANQFGLRIDDIVYDAANPVAVVDGYNLYRNGELIASQIKELSYVDKNVDLSEPVLYTVRSTAMVGDERVEGTPVSVWSEDGSGVENVVDTDSSIRVLRDGILVTGHAGNTILVSDATGALYVQERVASDSVRYMLHRGVYVVKCGDVTAKLIVR